MLTARSKSRPTGGVENAGAARGGCSVWAEAAQSTTALGHPSQREPRSGLLSGSHVCDCWGWDKR